MYKIKIFSVEGSAALEKAINEWLQANKDIVIHNSNFSPSKEDRPGSNGPDFFILYSSSIVQQQELKEMAAAAIQEQPVTMERNSKEN